MSAPHDERGSATLFATSCVALLLVLGAALGVSAALVRSHRQAQSAADLAALAGAQTLASGGDPCAAAARAAAANHATLGLCAVRDRDVVVEARVTGPRWLGLSADLTGSARAGPG